jgi:hypothetical protein
MVNEEEKPLEDLEFTRYTGIFVVEITTDIVR